jgi:uncharacterized protein YhfF/SAM-dependent methyltransferase
MTEPSPLRSALPTTALGLPGADRDTLNGLVLAGRKTATASLLSDYEEEGVGVPAVGARYGLIDSQGESIATIEVTGVTTCAFDRVDDRHARAEGEGFETAAEWRDAHRAIWPGVTGTSTVVLETFRVLQPQPVGSLPPFEELVRLGAEADVSGWDFSWLHGRATEERPPWGYARLLAERLAGARASLDVQTGGGEVLAEAGVFPPTAVATESWPPNVRKATRLLHPRGVAVVADPDEPPLPFADGAFDLVTSRHPATIWWEELHRVLAPGGTYFAQHVGPASAFELIEFFLGPLPGARRGRHPDDEVAEARRAGFEVVDVRTARTCIEIFDVAAVVYLLRKVIWWVPGFTVDEHRDRLRDLDALIRREGVFVAHSSRHLLELRRP